MEGGMLLVAHFPGSTVTCWKRCHHVSTQSLGAAIEDDGDRVQRTMSLFPVALVDRDLERAWAPYNFNFRIAYFD
jgi:hypothetical protein